MIELIKCSVGLVYNQSSIMSEKNELVFLKRDKFPYKDVYELPGGKLENGESPQDALIRELYEEIGVEQSQIISIQKHPAFIHHYDNFQVRLYVFTVKISDDSVISSKENKYLKYLDPLYHNEKHLESTYRIFRLLNLNKKICIINSKDKERIQEQINPEQYKKKTIRIRNDSLDINLYIDSLINYNKKIKNLKKNYKNNLIIDIPDLHYSFPYKKLDQFHGVHYNSRILHHLTKDRMYIRSNHLQTISASCHNANDIEKANKLNLDFIFLSPVLYKKDSRKILTWKSFKKLTKIAHMPVFALGGLKDNNEYMSMSNKYGGYGISGIRYF